MDRKDVAARLVKIAKTIVSGTIRPGDVCKVNLRMVSVGDLGTGNHMKILRKIIKEGDGKVLVESVRGEMAEVTAYDNPMSRIVGGASVNTDALEKVRVASIKTAAAGPHTMLVDLRRQVMERKIDLDMWVHAISYAKGADYMVGDAARDIIENLFRYERGQVDEDRMLDIIKKNIRQAVKDNEVFKGMRVENVHEPWMQYMDEKIKSYGT